MNRDDLRPIWTPNDFRETVIALRAAAVLEFADAAPVIDIHTRERLA